MQGYGSRGDPARGREVHALELLKQSLAGYLERLRDDGLIERYDTAILRPQSMELGGFILIQGTQEQIDALRRNDGFQQWMNQIQLVDSVGMVDAWVNDGLGEALDLYEEALRKAGLTS